MIGIKIALLGLLMSFVLANVSIMMYAYYRKHLEWLNLLFAISATMMYSGIIISIWY